MKRYYKTPYAEQITYVSLPALLATSPDGKPKIGGDSPGGGPGGTPGGGGLVVIKRGTH